MLTSLDEKEWMELGVDFPSYKSIWKSRYRGILFSRLYNSDEEEIHYFENLLEIKGIDRDTKIQLIVDHPYAINLFCIYQFSKDKSTAIYQYCNQNGIVLSQLEKNNPLVTTLSLIHIKKESLKSILLLSYWNTSRTYRKFSCDVDLTIEKMEYLINRMKPIMIYLTNNDKRRYRFSYFGHCRINEHYIFQIDRQINDKIVRNVGGNIRERTLTEIILDFNIVEHELIVKSNRIISHNILDRLIKTIGRRLKVQFHVFTIEKDKNVINVKKFEKALTEKSTEDNKIKIINIRFNNSNLDSNPSINLSQTYKKVDIKPAINSLIDFKIISLDDILNIKFLTIEFNNIARKIAISETDSGEIILLFDDSRFSDKNLQILQGSFYEQFGLPLNTPILPFELTNNFDKRAINIIQDGIRIENPTELELKDIDYCCKKNVIKQKNWKRIYCYGCRKRDLIPIIGNSCVQCISKEIKYIHNVIEIFLNLRGIRQYVRNTLHIIGCENKERIRERTFRGITYQFIESSYLNQRFFIYIAEKSINIRILKYFQRAAIPFLIVHLGHSFCKDIINDKLFSQVNIVQLINPINREQNQKKLLTSLEQQFVYSNQQISNSAIQSAMNVDKFINENDGYNYSDLEDDTFNIIKNIFNNSEKWGKEFNGRTMPEGITGFSFSLNNRNYNICFSWDCKFSEKENYKISKRSERDKARRYIKIAIGSEAVKSFSKKLNSYFIVTNKITKSDFTKFTKHALKIKDDEKPTIVLFEISALLNLHNLYHKYQKEIQDNPDTFLFYFYLLITRNSKGKPYRWINDEVIVELIEKFLSEKEEIQLLDTISVRNEMEADIL